MNMHQPIGRTARQSTKQQPKPKRDRKRKTPVPVVHPSAVRCSREQAAAICGCSVSTIRKHEQEGHLKVLRDSVAKNPEIAKVYYLVSEVMALAHGEDQS